MKLIKIIASSGLVLIVFGLLALNYLATQRLPNFEIAGYYFFFMIGYLTNLIGQKMLKIFKEIETKIKPNETN